MAKLLKENEMDRRITTPNRNSTEAEINDWFDAQWEKSNRGEITPAQMEAVADVYLDLMGSMYAEKTSEYNQVSNI